MTTIITAYQITPIFADPYWTGGYTIKDSVNHNVGPETNAYKVEMELDAGCEVIDTDFGPAILYRPEGWRMSLQEAVNLKLAREV